MSPSEPEKRGEPRSPDAQLLELQQRLRDNGALNQALLELIEHPVLILDADARIVWQNQASSDYVKAIWAKQSVVGDSLVDYATEEHLQDFRVNLQRAFSGESLRHTKEIQFPSGEIYWFTVRYIPLGPPGEQPEAICLSTDDVSREVLQRREARAFDAALNRLDAGVTFASVEPDYPLTYVNDGFCRISGYSREEILGNNCRFLQSDLEQGPELDRLREALENRKSARVTLKNRKKDGSIIYMRVEVSPVFSPEGQLLEYIGLQSDVTEEVLMRERLQRAQRMEALGQLAAGMAHDFNNDLQIILQSVDSALGDRELPPGQREHIEVIEKAGEHARTLLGDLTLFARSGRAESRKAKLDLCQLLVELEPMLRSMMGNMVTVHIERVHEPAWLTADRSRLEQIIVNLVANARDALAGRGNVWLSSAVQTNEVGQREVVLRVADDGPGMPEEVAQQVFEPLFSTKAEGTGLGLSSCLAIAVAHGGRMWVDSSLGSGTRFFVALPLRELS